MQLTFIMIAMLGSLYHILVRKRVDFVLASFFGVLIYFMPGFSGYVFDPYDLTPIPYVPIIDQTYWVFIAALVGNIVFSLIYRPRANIVASPLVTDARFDTYLSCATVVAFFLALQEGGAALFDPDKNNVLLHMGRFWELFSALAMICAFVGVVSRRWIPMICGLGALAFCLFVGIRSSAAIVGVALIIYYFSIADIKSIFSFKILSYAILFVIFVIFIFLYKQLYVDIKYGNYDFAIQKILSFETYEIAFGKSEPFATQTILNTVLMFDFRVSKESIFSAIIALFPFLSSIIDFPPNLVGFNFQDILFPHLDYGLASNIYANFYGIFGYMGIVIWIIMQNIIMIFFSRASLKWQGYKRIPLMLCGSLMSFYVVRSDIVYNITSLNRIIYTFLAMYLVFMVLAYFGKSGRQSLNDAAANSAHYNRP